MPPKHRLGRKRTKTQPSPRTQRGQSSTLNNPIVHSTIPNTQETNNESSLDSHSIPSTADLLTINANDRRYIQISKQVLLYEQKRKRITFAPNSEQAYLENGETSLPASITSDWRLVLQDSIKRKDLRQGCLSLFDQVDSGTSLSQTEVNHAVRFLNYTGMHIECRRGRDRMTLETIFPEEKDKQTRLVSSLINLLSHPSNTLRTVALSFFDVIFSRSSTHFPIAVATTGLVPKLFFILKPHEIPLNGTTVEFHRHITSILDTFFGFSSPEDIYDLPHDIPGFSNQQKLESKLIEPIFQPFCAYLRYLLATPVCPTDHCSGYSLLSNMS
ncbi:hypothetical protein BLNAU_21169 [Blattamonas nauphoetae]|uniref:Uncharacterized protein n=1 Tax=Blattamonas nauphoetae TaxID=2049346 RepID=A0ABQ9WXQ7_9EUKA|nr:hypothetical protein BLNAU_21169 [Blattamonas nauphoetae]